MYTQLTIKVNVHIQFKLKHLKKQFKHCRPQQTII